MLWHTDVSIVSVVFDILMGLEYYLATMRVQLCCYTLCGYYDSTSQDPRIRHTVYVNYIRSCMVFYESILCLFTECDPVREIDSELKEVVVPVISELPKSAIVVCQNKFLFALRSRKRTSQHREEKIQENRTSLCLLLPASHTGHNSCCSCVPSVFTALEGQQISP